MNTPSVHGHGTMASEKISSCLQSTPCCVFEGFPAESWHFRTNFRLRFIIVPRLVVVRIDNSPAFTFDRNNNQI
jgi:hypothetical protein